MALVSMKPTSAGRRHMVKVVHPELHKGKPFAALTERRTALTAVTTTVTSPLVIRVAATSVLIVSSTSFVTRTAFPPASSVSNTIRTVPLISLSCCSLTANAATSSPRRA